MQFPSTNVVLRKTKNENLKDGDSKDDSLVMLGYNDCNLLLR